MCPEEEGPEGALKPCLLCGASERAGPREPETWRTEGVLNLPPGAQGSIVLDRVCPPRSPASGPSRMQKVGHLELRLNTFHTQKFGGALADGAFYVRKPEGWE